MCEKPSKIHILKIHNLCMKTETIIQYLLNRKCLSGMICLLLYQISVGQPGNDLCDNASIITTANTCITGTSRYTGQTMKSATATPGIVASCGNTASADVWYMFTAQSAFPTITLSSIQNNLKTAGVMIQLLSGTCSGGFTSVACTAASGVSSLSLNTTVNPGGAGLTIGNTYYIRIATNNNSATTNNNNWGFTICVTDPIVPRIGNSYVNLSKNSTGGVVQKGDTLEIRMTVLVKSTTVYATRYDDNVPANTQMLTGTNDSIRIITNEGLTYKRYSLASGDDAGTYTASPGAGEYNIRLNLGLGTAAADQSSAPANNSATDATGAGNLPSSAKPVGGGGLMFATSFRVVVTGNVGDTITLNGGQFIYQLSAGTADITISGTPYKILITDPLTLCSNAVGVNNASENGGTFGSGSTLNRSTDLTIPIAGYTFVAASSSQAIGDGQYAIVNNTSPISGTNVNAGRKPNCPSSGPADTLCTNRMFGGYWYISGDHSGTNTSAGNPPVASGTTGGYMLAVNADYVASEAYRQTLSNLCPNTYYEFSAWFQNICPTCGIDSTGAQFAGTVTAPANGYPGVYPNLAFSLDGVDRYTTGQIDTVGWVKKGFVFLTGPTQTTATLSIRNNAQGGGGNDWVMDDISIATCFPSMSYSPTSTPNVCSNNAILIGDTVRSLFNNYTYYVWQRSQDNGATWSNITTTQTAAPVLNGSQYEYITSYNVPTTATTLADSGDIYRVYTATTAANISNPSCIANDGSAPISLSVLDCGVVLKSELLSFNGNLVNERASLSWTTSKEEKPVHFIIERSDDGNSFNSIGTLSGHNDISYESNYYTFIDPYLISTKKWYRIIMLDDFGTKKYSRIIQLGGHIEDFDLTSVVNPFNNELYFDVTTTRNLKINVDLVDMQGKPVKTSSYLVYTGVNSLTLKNTGSLPAGIYTIIVRYDDKLISRRVVKSNN
jgi:hypothetical protein